MAKEMLKKEKKEVKKVKKVKETKKGFWKEVKSELSKVKWPTKKEMVKYSIAVIGFIIIFGVFFYGLDALFATITSLIKGL